MAENKIRVLVFPCGSEIGLEIFRSLKYSRHIELFGASSVDDHGRFVYDNYSGDIPFVDSPLFDQIFLKLIRDLRIDAVFPTMDLVIAKLSKMGDGLPCRLIGSPHSTNLLALSKKKTYEFFREKIRVPVVHQNLEQITEFPVFGKPDIGYGSRGTKILRSANEVRRRIEKEPNHLIMEFLPGEEFTVDCFTDRHGKLLFSAPRKRGRIQKGISVNTYPSPEIAEKTNQLAQIINREVKFRGSWFFQVKQDRDGNLTLLEIASRLGGSSALFRAKGINFALMSIFDAFDYPVNALENTYWLELDRALDQRFKIQIQYNTVYIDLDDCLILGGRVNSELVGFIFQCINQSKKIVLITKHEQNLNDTLSKFRLTTLFDAVIHLDKSQHKSDFIQELNSIFIDDSFSERNKVMSVHGIPVFAPDAVAALITD